MNSEDLLYNKISISIGILRFRDIFLWRHWIKTNRNMQCRKVGKLKDMITKKKKKLCIAYLAFAILYNVMNICGNFLITHGTLWVFFTLYAVWCIQSMSIPVTVNNRKSAINSNIIMCNSYKYFFSEFYDSWAVVSHYYPRGPGFDFPALLKGEYDAMYGLGDSLCNLGFSCHLSCVLFSVLSIGDGSKLCWP